MSSLKQAQKRQLDSDRTSFARQVEKQKAVSEKALGEMRQALTEARDVQESIRESYESLIEKMKRDHQAALEAAAEQHANEVADLQREHRSEVRRLNQEVDAVKADGQIKEKKFQNATILAQGLHGELRRVHSVAASMVGWRNAVYVLCVLGSSRHYHRLNFFAGISVLVAGSGCPRHLDSAWEGAPWFQHQVSTVIILLRLPLRLKKPSTLNHPAFASTSEPPSRKTRSRTSNTQRPVWRGQGGNMVIAHTAASTPRLCWCGL